MTDEIRKLNDKYWERIELNLRKHLSRKVRDVEDREDLLGLVYAKTLKMHWSVTPYYDLWAGILWHKIVPSVTVDYYRRKTRQSGKDLPMEDCHAYSVEDKILTDSYVAELVNLMQQNNLGELLARTQGYSYAEIAEQFKCSEQAARNRSYRQRAFLQNLIRSSTEEIPESLC